MKNWFLPHIPKYIDAPEPDLILFNTKEELLNAEIIKRAMADPDFSHFAISDNCLMKISDNGYQWTVLGYLHNPNDFGFPKWHGPKYKWWKKCGCL